MIKIHAMVTKEIEITEEQAGRIIDYLCDYSNCHLKDIQDKFCEGVDSGDYVKGYIPGYWLHADLKNQLTGELAERYNQIDNLDDFEIDL